MKKHICDVWRFGCAILHQILVRIQSKTEWPPWVEIRRMKKICSWENIWRNACNLAHTTYHYPRIEGCFLMEMELATHYCQKVRTYYAASVPLLNGKWSLWCRRLWTEDHLIHTCLQWCNQEKSTWFLSNFYILEGWLESFSSIWLISQNSIRTKNKLEQQ